jgi:hypothetical protein
MAKRLLKRRELRKAAEAAEQRQPKAEKGAPAKPAKKKEQAQTPAAPKVKKPRKKKEPPRMCARWGVFDAGMKQVAIFDFNQRDQADKKVADLIAKKNAVFFLQLVKEPMPEPPPAETTPA